MKAAGPLLVACLCLLSAGCLDFEQQTLVLKVSPDGKTAQCLLVYEGLCVNGDDKESLDLARKELTTLATSQRAFYLLANYPFKVDLNDDPEAKQENELRKARVRKLLTIKSGSFFRHGDREEKLGLWQNLSCSDVPALLRELNAYAADALVEEAKIEREMRKDEGEARKMSEETLRLWDNAPTSQPKVFRWKDNQLLVLIPTVARDEAIALGKEFSKDLNDADRKTLAQNHFKLQGTNQGLLFTIGPGGAGPITIRFRPSDRRTNDLLNHDLMEHAKGLPTKMARGVTAEKLVADFLGQPAKP